VGGGGGGGKNAKLQTVPTSQPAHTVQYIYSTAKGKPFVGAGLFLRNRTSMAGILRITEEVKKTA
jgi:hypothetical protein